MICNEIESTLSLVYFLTWKPEKKKQQGERKFMPGESILRYKNSAQILKVCNFSSLR